MAVRVSVAIASPLTVLVIVVVIALSGWYFRFSLAWQTGMGLAVGTASLLALVFLQRSQSHSDVATHLKLDELIKRLEGPRDEVASIEEKDVETLQALREDRGDYDR